MNKKMNRELKFRAWVDENCKSFYADQSCYNENDEFVPSMIYGDELAFEEYMPINDLIAKIPLMQYTGLKDKNGIEIYEGDIVRAISDYYEFDFIGEVVFKYVSFVIENEVLIDYNWTDYEIEIIGNIYENPELLEGDE